jgi:hypothetical protein
MHATGQWDPAAANPDAAAEVARPTLALVEVLLQVQLAWAFGLLGTWLHRL